MINILPDPLLCKLQTAHVSPNISAVFSVDLRRGVIHFAASPPRRPHSPLFSLFLFGPPFGERFH
jgi:hypothetical protein